MTMKFSVTKFFPRREHGANNNNNNNNKRTAAPRIPFGLQAIFIASNRGKDVHKPAPAHRVEVDEPAQKIQQPPKPKVVVLVPANTSPQDYLDSILKQRGYPTRRYYTLETGYRTQPTELQLASHGTHLVSLVRRGDDTQLRKVMSSGISPNPCNKFGESLLHMVCRHGSEPLLSCMLDAGSDVQVSDDYGRTPLHDSCWAPQPSFNAVVLLVNRDRDLFYMMDKRGCTPLDYVRKENWVMWIEFLDQHKDYWWPHCSGENIHYYKPPMVEVESLSRQIPDPKNAMPLELAKLVAAGRMTPSEARMMMAEEEDDEEDYHTVGTASMTTLDFENDDFEDSDSFDSDYDSEDDASSIDSSDDYDSDEGSSDGSLDGDDMDDDEMLRQIARVLSS